MTHHQDQWSRFLGDKLFGDAEAPDARRNDWFVFGETQAAYELTDEEPPRYEQRHTGQKPDHFRVCTWIDEDALLSMTVDPSGQPTGIFVNIDGYKPKRVTDLADLGEEVERQRADHQPSPSATAS
ncbi:hypothetical protein SAMN05216329_1480 [Curtobacterium sp. YR515]|nr:hypothetical protein SAMN05216329_1480 [Curtobacterium sp. YR515]